MSDGGDEVITSASVVKQLGLTVDEPVTREDLLARIHSVEPSLAKDRAVRLLAQRERSAAELTRALTDSGYSSGVARSIVSRFIEVELVNDERFAGMYVRTRLHAGIGMRRIRQELLHKGIDAEIAGQAIASELQAHDELDRARQALRGRTASNAKERDRLIRRLVTRGFDLNTAIKAVDGAESE